jgi:hypothetical protein
MELSHNIFTELRPIAPAVANIGNNNPYTVPMGYFDMLAHDILKNIQPQQVVSTNPYAAPTGYFDSLANSILSKIRATEQAVANNEVTAELEKIAPFLNSISKQNIFSVPTRYFETFEINPKPDSKHAKVVSFGNNVSKWVTYAAAASIIFILSTASYLYVNQHIKEVDNSLTIEQRLAALNDDEIFNYLQNDLGDTDPDNVISIEADPKINDLLINISDEEIEDFYHDSENTESTGSGEEIIKGI